ncbi:hypothetical protein EDC01DRAFT_716746 [Geopyxis carbonaria]|nr:hypothetical protein EDC01DRAFT_716746 [Geopyxis carbonaria]
MDDDDLPSRLAALKAPSAPATPQKSSDEIAHRFEQIFARSPGAGAAGLPAQKSTPANPEDDKSTRDLVDAVQEEKDAWNISAEDEKAIEELLAEAATTGFDPADFVSTNDGDPTWTGPKTASVPAVDDVPDWLRDDTLDEVKSDADEEEAVLRRIRDELSFELTHDLPQPSELKPEGAEQEPEEDDPELSGLMERFQALGTLELPDVPQKDPGVVAKPKYTIAPKEVGMDETDTWCCICNEDAEYRCSGCDNDIYCSECLFEAHTGPDAGYEERRHKWTKYVRPKKILEGAS